MAKVLTDEMREIEMLRGLVKYDGYQGIQDRVGQLPLSQIILMHADPLQLGTGFTDDEVPYVRAHILQRLKDGAMVLDHLSGLYVGEFMKQDRKKRRFNNVHEMLVQFLEYGWFCVDYLHSTGTADNVGLAVTIDAFVENSSLRDQMLRRRKDQRVRTKRYSKVRRGRKSRVNHDHMPCSDVEMLIANANRLMTHGVLTCQPNNCYGIRDISKLRNRLLFEFKGVKLDIPHKVARKYVEEYRNLIVTNRRKGVLMDKYGIHETCMYHGEVTDIFRVKYVCTRDAIMDRLLNHSLLLPTFGVDATNDGDRVIPNVEDHYLDPKKGNVKQIKLFYRSLGFFPDKFEVALTDPVSLLNDELGSDSHIVFVTRRENDVVGLGRKYKQMYWHIVEKGQELMGPLVRYGPKMAGRPERIHT